MTPQPGLKDANKQLRGQQKQPNQSKLIDKESKKIDRERSITEEILLETKSMIEQRVLAIEVLWTRLKLVEGKVLSLESRMQNASIRISQLKSGFRSGIEAPRPNSTNIRDSIQAAEEVMKQRQKLSDQKPFLQPPASQTTT